MPIQTTQIPASTIVSYIKMHKSGAETEAGISKSLVALGGLISATAIGVVVGGIIAAIGAFVGVFARLFGSKWHESNEVRWLLSWYQRLHLGMSNVTSDNHVDESYLDDCVAWFTAVLGVPITTRNALAYLQGVTPSNMKPPKVALTYKARALGYLRNPEAVNVTYEQAVAACEVSDTLKFYTPDGKSVPPGYWANIPAAQVWFDMLDTNTVKENFANSTTNKLFTANADGTFTPSPPSVLNAAVLSPATGTGAAWWQPISDKCQIFWKYIFKIQ